MTGVKCPPATHLYRPLGKIVFCEKCADVQAILLYETTFRLPTAETEEVGTVGNPVPTIPEDSEPSAAELEAAITRLRAAAGLVDGDDDGFSEDENLGQRQVARVDEGFNGDPGNDSLPGPGL